MGERGVRGVLGLRARTAGSVATTGPKMASSAARSGGGIGYMPRLISSNDNPRDHRSLATEYCEP
jgi:hypothetical protein